MNALDLRPDVEGDALVAWGAWNVLRSMRGLAAQSGRVPPTWIESWLRVHGVRAPDRGALLFDLVAHVDGAWFEWAIGASEG